MDAMDKASDDLIVLVATYYDGRGTQEDQGPNTDDMLAALAAITADQLVSVCVSPDNIKESSRWIVGKEVDELLYSGDGDTLYIVVTAGSIAAGLDPEELPDMDAIVQVASMGDELTLAPPYSFSDMFYPTDWPPNAAVRFRGQVNAILDQQKLKGEERAITCAYATAKMLRLATEHYENPLLPLLITLETLAGVARMTPLQKEM